MTDRETKAIPGVIAYFTVSDSKAATTFYGKAFGARLVDRRENPDGRSMHVHVEINGGSMMFNDPFPEYGTMDEAPRNIVLHLMVDDADAWWTRAVNAGAEIVHPIKVEFWGDKYGQLRDPFGVLWGIVGPG